MAGPLQDERAAVGAIVKIDYLDRFGEATSRYIKLEGIYRSEDQLYLSAYCYLVHEGRTFRIDRIQSVFASKSAGAACSADDYFKPWIAALPPTPLPSEYTFISAEDRAFGRLAILPLMWVLAAEAKQADAATLLEFARARFAQRAPFSDKDGYRWANWIAEQAPTFDVAASCFRRLNKRDRALLEDAVKSAVSESPRRAGRAKRLKIAASPRRMGKRP